MKVKRLLLPLVLILSLPSSADADERPLRLFFGQSATADSNLFRLPEGTFPAAVSGTTTTSERRETVLATFGGLTIDRTYRRQRLHGDFTATHYRYQAFSYLDFTGLSGRVDADWSLGRRWTGILNYERLQAPSNDAVQSGFQTGYRLYDRLAGEADYRWHPHWSVGGGVARIGNTYNNSINAFADHDADVADARVTYRSRRGNQVRASVRRRDGAYSNRDVIPGNGVTQSYSLYEYESEIRWALGSDTTMAGAVGYASIGYEAGVSRPEDVDGAIGRVALNWAPGPRIAFALAARRSVGPDVQDSLYASFVSTYVGSAAASYALTTSVSLRGFAEWRLRSLGEDGGTPGASPGNPSDGAFNLTAAWTLKRRAVLSVVLGHETRVSRNPAFPHYESNALSANLRVLAR